MNQCLVAGSEPDFSGRPDNDPALRKMSLPGICKTGFTTTKIL